MAQSDFWQYESSKPMSKRGKKAMRKDIVEGAIPWVVALGVLYFFIKSSKPSEDNRTANE